MRNHGTYHIRSFEKARSFYKTFAISFSSGRCQRATGQDIFQKPCMAYRRILTQILSKNRQKTRSQEKENKFLNYIPNADIISLVSSKEVYYGKR